MPPRIPLDTRLQVVHLSQGGASQRSIALKLGLNLHSVNRIMQAFRDEGRIGDAARAPRPRSTTPEEDLLIVAAACDNPFLNARELRSELSLDVSTQTIRNRLHEVGLRSRVAPKKPLLTDRNKENRLQFCQDHAPWTEREWEAVVFSDESTFTTSWHQMQRVYRPVHYRLVTCIISHPVGNFNQMYVVNHLF